MNSDKIAELKKLRDFLWRMGCDPEVSTVEALNAFIQGGKISAEIRELEKRNNIYAVG